MFPCAAGENLPPAPKLFATGMGQTVSHAPMSREGMPVAEGRRDDSSRFIRPQGLSPDMSGAWRVSDDFVTLKTLLNQLSAECAPAPEAKQPGPMHWDRAVQEEQTVRPVEQN